MMTILARILPAIFGSKLLPAGLLVTVLTFGHQWWQERDARIALESAKSAKQVCEAEHKLVLMTAERDHAMSLSKKKDQAIEFERQVSEELRSERRVISEEFAAFKASASSDPRCLSDGVLKLLRGDGDVVQGGSKR